MKRLQKGQDKNQIYKYLAILIIVIVLISTIGIKLLVNVSLFIAGISNRDQTNSAKSTSDENFLPSPEIYDLPDATNSAQIEVSGRSTKGLNLLIYVNDERQKKIVLDDDLFKAEINLKKGENIVYVQVEDPKSKKKKESDEYRITFIKGEPKLEIESPKDGDRVKKDEIAIIGQIKKEDEIRINSAPVIIDSEGKFSHTIRLSPGDNKIKIEVFDIAGNRIEKELTVTYVKED